MNRHNLYVNGLCQNIGILVAYAPADRVAESASSKVLLKHNDKRNAALKQLPPNLKRVLENPKRLKVKVCSSS